MKVGCYSREIDEITLLFPAFDHFFGSNVQKLVYKQGQPGITKATVSVVFDKSDRSRSPLGYENRPETTVTRRIVVGGRNKYLINGHLAQPSQVQNLFHSVQLNVNNPHFLIMHERITCLFNYADCLSIRR